VRGEATLGGCHCFSKGDSTRQMVHICQRRKKGAGNERGKKK